MPALSWPPRNGHSATRRLRRLLEKDPSKRPASAGEVLQGLEHLDFAIGELRDMKMQPSLERALRHREILTA